MESGKPFKYRTNVMKHHIVITRGQFIVENMMSKIATPSELRARLAKKFPGKYAIYFRTVDPQYGMFFVKGQMYFWYIDSCTEPKQRKPKGKPERRLIREPKSRLASLLSLVAPTCDPYRLYEGDVFSIPEKDSIRCMAQQIAPNIRHHMLLVQGIVNGLNTFINVRYLKYMLPDARSSYDVIKEFAGKTVRVTEAIQYTHDPQPGYRGLLSGKPITWWLQPRLYPGYRYKYKVLQEL